MKLFQVYLFVILSLPVATLAQQDVRLPGLVVEQNSRYRTGQVRYLDGAFIHSKGASPTRSDANGSFTLVFADQPPGGSAKISVQKPGYKVVNERELENATILGRLSPLKVVLSDEKTLRENQLAYYQIAEDLAAKEKERKLALLEKDAKAKARIIAELEADLKRKIQNEQEAIAALEEARLLQEIQGKEAADRLLLVNLDDATVAFRRAYEAYLKKDLEKALAILDSIDSQKRLENLDAALSEDLEAMKTLESSIAKKEEQKRQEIEQVIFKARLHGMNLEFGEAEKNYLLALRHDSTNVELLWEMAEFNANLNRFDHAIVYAEKSFSYNPSDQQSAGLLNIIGVMFLKNQQMKEAEEAFQQALLVVQQLVAEDSLTYLPELAYVLENMGHVTFRNRQFQRAGVFYEQALGVWQRLTETKPELAYPAAASSLRNLGLVYKEYEQFPQADTLLRQSLYLYQQLAEKTPGKHDADMAFTLHNLGLLNTEWNRPANAEAWLKEALAVRRRLSEKNPEAYLPDLALTLQSLGALYANYGDSTHAVAHLTEALSIFEKLEKRHPGAYLPELANSQNILGVAYSQSGNYGKALAFYTQAMSHRKKLAAENPGAFEPDLWTTYLNIAVLYRKELLETLDLTFRQKGLDLVSELEQRIQKHTFTKEQTPLSERIQKDVVYFKDFFQNATPATLELTRILEEVEKLERIVAQASTPAAAVPRQKEIIALLEAALKEKPGQPELVTRLAQSLGGLATYHLLAGQFAEARAAAEKGLETDSKEAWLNIPLAAALLYLGEFDKAAVIYRFWKDVYYHGEQTFKDIFLRDLEKLEEAGFLHSDVVKAREILK